MAPVLAEKLSNPGEVGRDERVGHSLRNIPQSMECGLHAEISLLVRAHHPLNGGAGEAGGPGVAQYQPASQLRHEFQNQLEPFSRSLRITNAQAEKAAVGGSELGLAS